MIVTYGDAQTPEAIAGRALLQDNQVLEGLADDINQSLALPNDVALLGSQCDEANAFWDSGAQSITLRYEDAALAEQIFTEAGDPDPVACALNSEYATFYHEVGTWRSACMTCRSPGAKRMSPINSPPTCCCSPTRTARSTPSWCRRSGLRADIRYVR